MPDEEPEQRPDAAPRTAPATKATAKKAPATKSRAKKAPARKATKKAAPRATIMNRIQELEERMADEPVDAAPVRLAQPQAVPVVAPPAAGEGAPEDASDAVAEAPPLPAVDPPAVLPAAAPPLLSPALPRANPRSDFPESASDTETRLHSRAEDQSGLTRVLAAALVLLLSLAAGLGVAAWVKDRPSTWRAEAVVAITPPLSGNATESTGDAAERYVKTAETTEFAVKAAQLGGISGEQVKGELKARVGEAGEVVLDARAVNADVAAELAEAASRQLVLEVLTDQAGRTDSSNRLGARILVPTTEAEKLQPTDRAALLGGTLAGVDILLVGVMVVVLLQRPSRRRGRR